MFVVKRDGRKEDVKFDKITSRINKLCYGLDSRFVDSIKISQKVADQGRQGHKEETASENRAYPSCLWIMCKPRCGVFFPFACFLGRSTDYILPRYPLCCVVDAANAMSGVVCCGVSGALRQFGFVCMIWLRAVDGCILSFQVYECLHVCSLRVTCFGIKKKTLMETLQELPVSRQ